MGMQEGPDLAPGFPLGDDVGGRRPERKGVVVQGRVRPHGLDEMCEQVRLARRHAHEPSTRAHDRQVHAHLLEER